MNEQLPFNANPQMVAMKQDIADRAFRLKVIENIATLGAVVAGVAALFMLPGAGLAGALLPLAIAAGSGLVSMVTAKARKKLEIDEEFLQSQMQGKNWWGGYREEVMEHGYDQPGAPIIQGAPPPRTAGRGK